MTTTSDNILKRVPPQNLEAEQSVLGAILLDNTTISRLSDALDLDDFYRESHRQIYRAMLDLDAARDPIDAITLTHALRNMGMLELIGGPAYIAELASVVPTAANILHYARIVRERAQLRAIGSLATDIASESYKNPANVPDFLEKTERLIFNLATHRTQAARFITMPEGTRTYLKQVERAYENQQAIVGLPTGFTDLDRAIGGLEPANLILIAARPSMGKTALACNIATNIALAGGTVAFFSLEMSSNEVIARIMCAHARLDLLRVKSGFIGERDFPRLAQTAAELSECSILIDDSAALTTVQLRSRCRLAVQRAGKPLTAVIVDYLQLMKPSEDRDSREREVAEISRALKELAKEMGVPVIALSQLSRQVEGRSDKRPLLADLRESGALEQDADIILFIYRDEVYKRDSKEKGVAEINVAKQRNGPTGTEKLTWIANYTRFENYMPEMLEIFDDARTPPE